MTSSTETGKRPESEFSTSFVVTMVALTVLTLVLFTVSKTANEESRTRFARVENYAAIKWAWAPYIMAAGNIISQGLQEFSQATSEPLDDDARTISLAGLIVFYVSFPTILLLLWREREKERSAGKQPTRERVSYVLLMVTGIFVGLMCVGTIGSSVAQRMVFQSLQSAQAVQKNKDQLINTINEVMWRLRQHRALPASLGGGEGSYDGFTLPPDVAATPDGTVDLDIVPDDVTITVVSALYDGASVGVVYTAQGITTWTYEGVFR